MTNLSNSIRIFRPGHGSPSAANVVLLVAISTGWAKKTGPFLRVDNFAMVSDRKAYYMSKILQILCRKKI